MLTERELNKIFSWEPYREDWNVNRNLKDDNIGSYFGNLIKAMNQNPAFDSYYSEDGGLGNYLEFFCYPRSKGTYEGNAIVVCVSTCAPLTAYGQTAFCKNTNSFSCGGLFKPENIYNITDSKLADIETGIKSILIENKLNFLDREFVSRLLPIEVSEHLKNENHNDGNQYLHGIFQKTD